MEASSFKVLFANEAFLYPAVNAELVSMMTAFF